MKEGVRPLKSAGGSVVLLVVQLYCATLAHLTSRIELGNYIPVEYTPQ